MIPRSLAAALAALLFLPACAAQAESSLTLAELPEGRVEGQGGVAASTFQVVLSLDGAVCLGAQAPRLIVDLAARPAGSEAPNLTVEIPRSLAFNIPAQAAMGYTDSREVTLIVRAPAELKRETEADITVTATMAGSGGCQTPIPAAQAEGTVQVEFEPTLRALQEAPDSEMPVPWSLAVGAVALALLLRRRA